MFLLIPKVSASSVSISVSQSSAVVGSSGTATVTVSADGKHIGQIYGTFSCGSLGNKDLTYVESTSPATSKSFTINWTASQAGTYTCSVSNLQVGILEEPDKGLVSLSASSKTITITAPSSNSSGGTTSGGSSSGGSNYGGTTSDKKTYSSNNYLSSLEVIGYNLDQEFNKDTLEYSVEVPGDVEKVNIKAALEDNTASLSGTGEITVSEGVNKIIIKVTAQNGNEKNYIINLTVKQLDPIVVKINNKEYTLMRKEQDLQEPTSYTKTTLKIDDNEVFAYYNEKTKTYLVILKDDKGVLDYYIYKDGKYTLYKEFKVGNIVLSLIDDNSVIPSSYTKTTIDYNDSKISVYYKKQDKNTTYASDDKSPFYLVYGTNIETGETSLYMYDSEEGTLQRYNDLEVKYYKTRADSYFMYLMITLGIVGLSFVIIAIVLLVKKKKSNRLRFKGI